MEREELWIALAEILGPRSPVFVPLLERFETPEAIFAADRVELAKTAPGLGEGMLSRLARGPAHTDAARILVWCRRNGVRTLAFGEADYPRAFRNLPEPPVLVYCRGKIPEGEQDFSVGVVGTRRADEYGANTAYKLSFELAAAGATIVSGMAEGIDGIAAAAALDAGGRTVAVLGCGIDIAYPRHHARLMREIAEHGAVLSEYAPGTRPNGWNFPVRNRLISALSDALLVVEAGERSGALITAKYAVLQGKALFAVPGDITEERSAGTNRLLEEGAHMACDTEDILAKFRFLYRGAVQDSALIQARNHSSLSAERLRAHGMRAVTDPEKTRRRPRVSQKEPLPAPEAARGERDLSALTERQKRLYDTLPDTPFPLDALTGAGIGAGELAAEMTLLELYGLVAARPGGLYEKT